MKLSLEGFFVKIIVVLSKDSLYELFIPKIMKYLFALFFLLPRFLLAQSLNKNPVEKLGPNPIYFVDSVKLTKDEFLNFDVKTIASLQVLTDTDATNKFGSEAKDGAILIMTKSLAVKHYVNYFRKKSLAFDSLYSITKSDSTFQYIINDKIKEKDCQGDLAAINDDLFISISILTADDLRNKYNILDKKTGILIKCNKPKNLFNSDSKF